MLKMFSSIFVGLLALVLMFLSIATAKVEVYDDISMYNEFIGENAREGYKNKWDMDEEIFPKSITDTMKVLDYKMVYYNPWDAQYLSYLVVEYNEEEYNQEVGRLKHYESNEYIGYYGVTGFSKYTLLAMYADSYQGFVYALTDNENKIIYVELIFCNYLYDIGYEEYIDNDYLPDGFDATDNNQYRMKMLDEMF